jgi:hypothetical protein
VVKEKSLAASKFRLHVDELQVLARTSNAEIVELKVVVELAFIMLMTKPGMCECEIFTFDSWF